MTDHRLSYRDTVCSVGFIPHRLSFASCTQAIRVSRHALSLDERRISFEANYHHGHSALPEGVCDKLHSDANHTDVKEVWFAGSHSGACHSSGFQAQVPRTPYFETHIRTVTVASHRCRSSILSPMLSSLWLAKT